MTTKKEEVEIISLRDDTPSYEGYSDLVRFGNRYFRTRDAEGYSSHLKEVSKKEYLRLLKYKEKNNEK